MKQQTHLRWIWLSVIVVILDQISKYWLSHHFFLGETKPILPFFNLVLAHNQGAAFSFLSHAGNLASFMFATIAAIVSIGIIIWLYRLPKDKIWYAIALAFILGGALGNLIDRIHYGYVIDFIEVYYQQWYFPAFNLADSAITLGAVILIIDLIFSKKS